MSGNEASATHSGILYGSSAAGIAAGLGVSKEEAEELIAMYFDLYPDIRQYIDDTHAMAEANKMVFTPMGFRKQEFGLLSVFRKTAIYNAAKRNAQNNRIQGLASTAGLDAFANLNTAIKQYDAMSLATVYDSIELEAPIRHAAKVIEEGFYYLNDKPQEDYDWLDFPIGVDAEIGFNWGEVKEVHRGITQHEIEVLLGVQ